VDLNAVFPPGRMHTPKVKAFVDFLSENLKIEHAAMRILCFQFMKEECQAEKEARAQNQALTATVVEERLTA
jgi:hypothetical protein